MNRAPWAALGHLDRQMGVSMSKSSQSPRVSGARLEPRARVMRRHPTLTEHVLWQAIRGRRLGVTFRRQVPLGPSSSIFSRRGLGWSSRSMVAIMSCASGLMRGARGGSSGRGTGSWGFPRVAGCMSSRACFGLSRVRFEARKCRVRSRVGSLLVLLFRMRSLHYAQLPHRR